MKKLKLPLYVNLTYLMLTVVAPIIFVMISAYEVKSTTFSVTFTVICASLITVIFVKKYVIKSYSDKLVSQCATLELNYETKVGDQECTKALYAKNKIILYLLDVVQIVMIGILTYLIVIGMQNLGMQLKGCMTLICLLYIIAIFFKLLMIYIYFLKKSETSDK